MDGVEVVLFWFSAGERAVRGELVPLAVWLLAFVFCWSGAVKLRRPLLAAAALVNFRLARRPRRLAGWLTGSTELLLAVALPLAPRLALPLAALMLTGFSALLLRGLRAGERFPCYCFGDPHAALSHLTLARTALLALTAWAAGAAAFITSPTVLAPEPGLVALSLLGMLVLAARVPTLVRGAGELRDASELARQGAAS